MAKFFGGFSSPTRRCDLRCAATWRCSRLGYGVLVLRVARFGERRSGGFLLCVKNTTTWKRTRLRYSQRAAIRGQIGCSVRRGRASYVFYMHVRVARYRCGRRRKNPHFVCITMALGDYVIEQRLRQYTRLRCDSRSLLRTCWVGVGFFFFGEGFFLNCAMN